METKPQQAKSSTTTYVTGALAAFRAIQGYPVYPAFDGLENDCRHYSVRGEVLGPDREIFIDTRINYPNTVSTPSSPYHGAINVPALRENGAKPLWFYELWNNGNGTWVTQARTAPAYFRAYSLRSLCQKLSKGLSGTGWAGITLNWTLSNFEWDFSPSLREFRMSWLMRQAWGTHPDYSYDFTLRMGYDISIQYDHRPGNESFASGIWHAINTGTKAIIRQRSEVVDKVKWGKNVQFLTTPGDRTVTHVEGVNLGIMINSDPWVDSFQFPRRGIPSEVRRGEVPDVVLDVAKGGLPLAVDDALSKIIPSVSVFETLAEYQDIGSLLKGESWTALLKDVADVTGHSFGVNTPWRVFRGLLNAYSAASLLRDFVVSPTINLINEFDAALGSAFASLAPLYSGDPVFGRSAMDYDWDGKQYRIVCRSSLRFDIGMSAFSPLLIEYQKWGLTPLTAWETFPWSFAIDWWTGIADSIKRMQNVLLAYALGLRFCSTSYVVTTDILPTARHKYAGVHRAYHRINGTGTPSATPGSAAWHRSPNWLGSPLSLAIQLASL